MATVVVACCHVALLLSGIVACLWVHIHTRAHVQLFVSD